MGEFFLQRKNIWRIAYCLVVLIFFLLIINFRPSDRLFVVHYKVFSGADFFGNWLDLYYFGAAAILVLFFNFGLSRFFRKREKFLSDFFAFASVVLEILILISVLDLIFINR